MWRPSRFSSISSRAGRAGRWIGHQAIQLHGSETPERAAQVRARFGLPVWKALPIASAADVARAEAYAGAADLVLFDAKTPKGTLPGGMGLSFDVLTPEQEKYLNSWEEGT